jgi:uncharacterized protein (TIGR02145 family)
MNKLFSIFNFQLSILLGGFLLLIACKEDKEEPLHFETTAPAAYTFPETEASATFTVSGNTAWSIEVTEGRDLCSVTPASGKSDATVTVHVTTNPAYLQERTMLFMLTAGDYTKQVNITQAAPPCPDFDPGAIATAGQTVTAGGTPATINSTQAATGGDGNITYQWYKNGNAISSATAANYTPPKSDANTAGAITYTRRAKDNTCNTTFTPSTGSWVLTVIATPCHAPGTTATFGNFSPCASSYGTTWTLTDTRDNKTYKVKYMADNRFWMVQDLAFGDRCTSNSYNSTSLSKSGGVNSTGTYYGNCRTNTQPGAGYLYDWQAAVNHAQGYAGGSYMGCSGSGAAANACQGICPTGWHLPTGGQGGEFQQLYDARGCQGSNDECWNASTPWEGAYGGACSVDGYLGSQGSIALYLSCTCYNEEYGYILWYKSGDAFNGHATFNRSGGGTVRCVRNY